MTCPKIVNSTPPDKAQAAAARIESLKAEFYLCLIAGDDHGAEMAHVELTAEEYELDVLKAVRRYAQ
jgi:arginine repressor